MAWLEKPFRPVLGNSGTKDKIQVEEKRIIKLCNWL